MKKTTLNLVLLLSLLLGCATPPPARLPSNDLDAPDYARIFGRTREILLNSSDKSAAFTSLKKIPENILVREMMNQPELLEMPKDELITELSSLPPIQDPAVHTRLQPPKGQPGYKDLKMYVDHPYYEGTTLVKASNLVKVWKDFILKAKKEIVLNVFEFDLEEIADALIAQAKAGLDVRVGIDRENVIKVKPEVAAIEKKLLAGGVKVTGVMPVALNHQKIMAFDWSIPSNASVLFSSGNLTQSCLDPEGDLKGTKPLPPESIPNANHLLTMKSWVLANLVAHELTKTLDPKHLIRGTAFPLNGSYQVTGPGVDPETTEAYPEPSIVLTFSPGGGYRNINKNIIAYVIRKETGPIRMLQFAYASDAVDQALLERAQTDKKFDFLAVGDNAFVLRDFSRFVSMSGLKRYQKGKKFFFEEDKGGRWYQGLGPKKLASLRKKIFLAPKVYKEGWTKVDGKSVRVSAKLHHKVLATPNFAILGTSFNFSEGAEKNNEQILVIRDSRLSKVVSGMVKYFVEKSGVTLWDDAMRRNAAGGTTEEANTDIEATATPTPAPASP